MPNSTQLYRAQTKWPTVFFSDLHQFHTSPLSQCMLGQTAAPSNPEWDDFSLLVISHLFLDSLFSENYGRRRQPLEIASQLFHYLEITKRDWQTKLHIYTLRILIMTVMTVTLKAEIRCDQMNRTLIFRFSITFFTADISTRRRKSSIKDGRIPPGSGFLNADSVEELTATLIGTEPFFLRIDINRIR